MFLINISNAWIYCQHEILGNTFVCVYNEGQPLPVCFQTKHHISSLFAPVLQFVCFYSELHYLLINILVVFAFNPSVTVSPNQSNLKLHCMKLKSTLCFLQLKLATCFLSLSQYWMTCQSVFHYFFIKLCLGSINHWAVIRKWLTAKGKKEGKKVTLWYLNVKYQRQKTSLTAIKRVQ